MKKNLFFIIALLLCIVMTFAACDGNTNPTNNDDTSTEKTGDTTVNNPTDTDSNDDTTNTDTENPPNEDTSEAPTESLKYERNDNGYTVTDVGEETIIIVPAEYNGLPVTEIGEAAFARKNITEITIPDSVTVIGLNAFHNCNDLVTVNIGENSRLTTIGGNAFSGNGSLKAIYLPKGVISIGDAAFNNCGSLDNITVHTDNSVYSSEGNCLIEKASGILIRGTNNTVIPASVTEIAPSAFRRAKTMTELVIPTTVTKIGNYFIADSSITTVRYEGTQAQWDAIEKSNSMWNFGNREVALICSDSEQ